MPCRAAAAPKKNFSNNEPFGGRRRLTAVTTMQPRLAERTMTVKTVDKIKYPDDLDKILLDADLGPIFREYVKKNQLSENLSFLDAAAKSRNNKVLYEKFIANGSRNWLNIPSDMREEANELAKTGDWKHKGWKKLIDRIDTYIFNLVDDNIPAFFRHELFKDFHTENLRSKIKLPDSKLEELGVDKKNKKEVVDLMALFVADKNAGGRAVVTLAKKKKTRLSPKDFLVKIKKLAKVG
jgi:hypothetical protein